jgi:hypothetical protein
LRHVIQIKRFVNQSQNYRCDSQQLILRQSQAACVGALSDGALDVQGLRRKFFNHDGREYLW